jgi:heme/copper-type cytochrome/quinol oxidase subunit 4
VNQEKFIKINQEHKNRLRFQSTIKSVIAIFLIALLITIPWRVVADQVFGSVKYSMSAAPQLIGPGLWLDKSVEAENYWVPFGVNWACRIDATECERINSLGFSSFKNSELLELAIVSALTQPVAYIQERYSYLKKFWISNYPTSSIKFKIASLLPLLYFLIIPLKKRGKWNFKILIITSIWLIFILLTAAQLAITHFESRYFIPLRLLLIGLFFSLIQSIEQVEKKIKFVKN